MTTALIKGLAVTLLSLFIGSGQTRMIRIASAGHAVRSCTGAGFCSATRRECTFPGADSIWPAVVADFPDGVSSDRRGPYLNGKNGVIDSRVGREGALTFYWGTATAEDHRSITVNLNRPVPGGGGVPLGIQSSGNRSGLITQRGMVGDTVKNLLDIAVGQKEQAAMMSITFHINGRKYLLQVGPLANGHCMDAGDGVRGKNLVQGTGTSMGTIFRASRTKWVMDLPPGSIGRLFDIQDSWDHALDKGLYFVHLHYEIGR